MANRRMFSAEVVESDSFMGMPVSARELYFHLGMATDDDGFVSSPLGVMRMCSAAPDDLNVLEARGFVIVFTSGVLVLPHHFVNNSIRADRRHATLFSEEMKLIEKVGDIWQKAGCLPALPTIRQPGDNQVTTKCQPTGCQVVAQPTNQPIKNQPTNQYILSGKPDDADVAEIVSYLNERAGTNYRPGSKATARHIKARLGEGFTVDDFKAVIDTKVNDWGLDPSMRRYLRPETLFGSKFEGYLNQRAKAPAFDYGGCRSVDDVLDELEASYDA